MMAMAGSEELVSFEFVFVKLGEAFDDLRGEALVIGVGAIGLDEEVKESNVASPVGYSYREKKIPHRGQPTQGRVVRSCSKTKPPIFDRSAQSLFFF